MCTAFVLRKKAAYFGRNMDLDVPFGEQVVITPENYLFPLKNGQAYKTHLAMIGMAAAAGTYPLYAEAVNEAGLAGAGLNFPGSAVYHDAAEGADNITPYELIPWILGQARSVREARALLKRVNLLAVPFAPDMPLAPLHFIFADREETIVAEPMADGLHIYEDPYDVMTNNPPFPYHDWNMRGYRRLQTANGDSTFAPSYDMAPYAEGMGSMGLPGDPSSASRFVRTAFSLANAVCEDTEEACVTEAFHILDAAAMVQGTVRTAAGGLDITRYSCCVSMETGTYYYKTYWNNQITAVKLSSQLRQAKELTVYALRTRQQILEEN